MTRPGWEQGKATQGVDWEPKLLSLQGPRKEKKKALQD